MMMIIKTARGKPRKPAGVIRNKPPPTDTNPINLSSPDLELSHKRESQSMLSLQNSLSFRYSAREESESGLNEERRQQSGRFQHQDNLQCRLISFFLCFCRTPALIGLLTLSFSEGGLWLNYLLSVTGYCSLKLTEEGLKKVS